jgi:Helix-turn-helix of DDE superfamily endonuclease
MVEVLRPHLERHGKRGGQNHLSVEDQLLMTLQYWREYRTQFHIGLDFGVSESTVCRTIEKVETLLVRSEQFRLPGRQQLHQNTTDWEVVVVDGAESPIERPQKNRSRTILASARAIP